MRVSVWHKKDEYDRNEERMMHFFRCVLLQSFIQISYFFLVRSLKSSFLFHNGQQSLVLHRTYKIKRRQYISKVIELKWTYLFVPLGLYSRVIVI